MLLLTAAQYGYGTTSKILMIMLFMILSLSMIISLSRRIYINIDILLLTMYHPPHFLLINNYPKEFTASSSQHSQCLVFSACIIMYCVMLLIDILCSSASS